MSERDPLCGAAGGLDRGAVQVLPVIPADEIQHGFGVAEVMRAEARDRIEAQFEDPCQADARPPRDRARAGRARGRSRGRAAAQIAEDPGIAVQVLAASGSGGPGPLISRLMRDLSALPCPMTIVPGDISRKRLEQIS